MRKMSGDTFRERAIRDILAERDSHKDSPEADDTKNTPSDWVLFICRYATRWFNLGSPPYPPHIVGDFRSCMVKVASLAIAAIESIDRQQEKNGRTFYEQPRG